MEIVEEIVKLYSEINKIYIELHKLDINNRKKSYRFISLIGVLKKKLVIEKELVEQLLEQEEIEVDEVSIILGECTDRPFKDRFEDYIFNIGSDNLSLDMGLDNEMFRSIKYSKLYDACSSNIYLMYLSFLQEYADSESFSYLKDKILNYKYYNAFINHSIENILIDSFFNVGRVNYINLDFIADMLKLDDSSDIVLDCCMDTIRTTIKNILSINDCDYSDNDIRVASINNQSMLRAGLVIIDDNNYNDMKDNLFKEFESLCKEDNKIGVDIIKVIFKDRNNNKRRVRKISLGNTYD